MGEAGEHKRKTPLLNQGFWQQLKDALHKNEYL